MITSTRFTLPNGLRVVHHHDPGTAMVAVNLLYNVGARDESPEMTGMAHLFEHLMFGGSVNVPEFDAAIERAGGMNNAWTSNDFTNFFDIVPAANIETAFWLESDRMLSLAFSEKSLEVQRNVVIEEFKQVCLNRPYGRLGHELRSLLYERHPYRWPTIGLDFSHIAKVTVADEKRFFLSHYAPNNAVLAVAGNVTEQRVRDLAEKWFSSIPRREIAKRLYDPESPMTSPRRRIVTGNAPQTAVFVAFRMPGYGHPDYVPCDLLTDILASGRSSRFFRNLIMPGKFFSEADASISGSEEPGYLLLSAKLLQEGEEAEDRARGMLLDQLHDIADNGVSAEELERAVNRYESSFTFNSMSFLAKAQNLAMAEMHGEDINDTIGRYRAVTVDDIRRVARSMDMPATLIYRPD